MGMHTFSIPNNFSDTFTKLKPGVVNSQQIVLAQASYETMTACSIHAVASSPVMVEVWMANIGALPFGNRPDIPGWTAPPMSQVGDLWLPCPSIPTFTVVGGQNYFKRYDFDDVCSFIKICYTALSDPAVPTTSEVAFALRMCFK